MFSGLIPIPVSITENLILVESSSSGAIFRVMEP